MTEKIIEIEIPLLLPEIEDSCDDCLIRLQDALRFRKGILHVHYSAKPTRFPYVYTSTPI